MQDAQLISQAGQVESLASDGLVSVSTGAGQPQKNMELAKFADSLGSSVPLQQTSEQVSITGLYARTSDGKMVELTKESVAQVMAEVMDDKSKFLLSGITKPANPGGNTGSCRKVATISNDATNAVCTFLVAGTSYLGYDTELSLCMIKKNTSGISGELKVMYGGSTRLFYKTDGSVINVYATVDLAYFRISVTPLNSTNSSFEYGELEPITSDMNEIKGGAEINFGYNTLAELSSGVAEQMRANSSYPYMFRGFVFDANEAKDSGCYRIRSSSTNVSTQYGILEVDKTSDYIIQRCYSAETKTNVYVRMFFDNTWNEWQQL